MKKKLKEFLKESNLIEGVSDDDSLVQAKKSWDYCIGQEKMNSEVVLKTHKILMSNQKLNKNEIGFFRKRPVYIGAREGLHYSHIEDSIGSWSTSMNCSIKEKISDNWKRLHVDFEYIHPFVDGNGRTGRIFLNWQRVRSGLPILIIKNINKHNYYKWFL